MACYRTTFPNASIKLHILEDHKKELLSLIGHAAPACLLCGQAWAYIPEAHDSAGEEDTREECGYSLGPEMVGHVPTFVERRKHE